MSKLYNTQQDFTSTFTKFLEKPEFLFGSSF